MTPIKLDLGCGAAKRPGFIGVHRRKFDGVADLFCAPLVQRGRVGLARHPGGDQVICATTDCGTE
jgi:hypothetical protein